MSEPVHKVHAGYTLIAPIRPDRVEALTQLLSELRSEPSRLPFERTTTTHFVQISVIPAQDYGADELPATLMFATSFCGPAEVHVDELIREMGGELRKLLGHCKYFPDDCSDRQLAKFIRRHRRADTFYSGMQHLSPLDVQQHLQLRSEIESYLSANEPALRSIDKALPVHQKIQDHIRGIPGFEWAQEPAKVAPASFVPMHWRSLILYAVLAVYVLALAGSAVTYVICSLFRRYHPTLGAVVASLVLALVLFVLFVFGMLWGIHEAEVAQPYVAERPPDNLVRSLADTQNHRVINEMTVAGPIKNGVWRPIFLRMALWLIARVAEGLPWIKQSDLDKGINIPTVATARWITIDGGRRLIFISNFTNAAEPYVRDFIDTKAGAMRINLSFGFGGGYPRTDFIVLGGALFDPNAFIYVVATNQLHTDFWYCPYTDISIDNIKHNRMIRDGLFATLDEDQARDMVAPAMTHHPHLDRHDIQGLLARGYASLSEAEFLLLQVDHPEGARAYLRRLAERVARVGDAAPKDVARQVAFTYQGLKQLDVPQTAYDSFSREFIEGMDDAVRSLGLGDEEDNHPRGWAWGRVHGKTPSNPAAHVLVMLYAAPGLLQQLVADEVADMGGAFTVTHQPTRSFDDKKEHFGWADGLSNPSIAGLGKQPRAAWTDDAEGKRHPIAAGEFILGYPNEYARYNESPTAELADDPGNHLRATADGTRKDLGFNGTYLVYRQMRQFVPEMWRYLATSKEPGDTTVDRAIALGAKMVGRWPGGAPVIDAKFDDPTKAQDNGFKFYAHDKAGVGCPLGSHIRRANPRDHFPPDRDDKVSTEMVRKHQLLRRGRPYGERFVPDLDPAKILDNLEREDKELRGLHFVCLVSHINRQFEQVQRNWIASPVFSTLTKDGDPIIGVRVREDQPNQSDQFTCNADPVRRTYTNLPKFTQLVGGAYFFLPGINALRFIARS